MLARQACRTARSLTSDFILLSTGLADYSPVRLSIASAPEVSRMQALRRLCEIIEHPSTPAGRRFALGIQVFDP